VVRERNELRTYSVLVSLIVNIDNAKVLPYMARDDIIEYEASLKKGN
jgi:hypothetical protein